MSLLNEMEIAVRKIGAPHTLRTQADKKNYAESFSRALAQKFADGLRKEFDGILPNKDGERHESRARAGKGLKKLDVNFSTPELGLGLGLTLKTLSFPDPSTGRYSHNYSRIDNELRAEAKDYHQRQPYAVLVGVIFLPAPACFDGRGNHPSSFGAAARMFRFRTRRQLPTDEQELLERLFLGVYEPEGARKGEEWYFDVELDPPKNGRPIQTNCWNWTRLLEAIRQTYDRRNDPGFVWGPCDPETPPSPKQNLLDAAKDRPSPL